MMTLRTANCELRTVHVALSVIFFLSGGASLLFETPWFRECGLVFGNGAWASAIVLASFMAGLAIGNLLSPKFRGDPLLIPAIGMGATLPTVVRALSRHDENFGCVLALLYSCNTIGAVAGALAGELLLIRLFGVHGTGIVAAACSMTAGLSALGLRSA